ncbi:MAG: hypothetical protein PHD81_05005 [Candidatus Nanoarchaeia archaeon]|nr:hypothetical protein [Candidatus Nanoarchaeia archaeon]MDD5588437.1 hypothetical protein [Candidatus Nanoarchaeia archaeon]
MKTWQIEVNYRGIKTPIELSDKLLDSKTQEQHIKQAIEHPDDFNIPNMQLFCSIMDYIIKYNNKQSRMIRSFLKESATGNYLITSSGVLYRPTKIDTIIHDKDMPSEFIDYTPMVDSDRRIIESNQEQMKILTGLDIKQINKITKKIFGVKPYISKLNSTPIQEVYKVARFGAYPGGANFNCHVGPDISNPTLGVCENFSESYTTTQISRALKETSLLGIKSILLKKLKGN